MSVLRVMSFNVRFDTKADADNAWPERKEAAAEVIRMQQPQVVGIQEALAHQRADLIAALRNYGAVGRAREAGGRGEFVPILYDLERFELVRNGDFWLSATPDVEGSLGWDAKIPRIGTWAILHDRRIGREILVLNTHLDVWGAQARIESAMLIVNKIAEFGSLPCILTADLNVGEDDEPFTILKAASLHDTYRELFDEPGPATVHHYTQEMGHKIDFVMCDPNWRVVGAEVVKDRPFGKWPSDHYPVVADLEFAG